VQADRPEASATAPQPVTGGPVKAAQVADPPMKKATGTSGTPRASAAPSALPQAPAAAPMAAPRTITLPPAVQAVSDAPLEQEQASEEIDPEPTRVPEKTTSNRPEDEQPSTP